MMKELVLRVAMSYTDEDFREVVEEFVAGECIHPVTALVRHFILMPGKPGKFEGVEKLITSRILLDDVVSKGFEELVTNKDDHIKIMVTPKRECLES